MEQTPTTKILRQAEIMRRAHPELRHGQAMMNALFYENREVYEMIQPTESNCFYEDKKIPAFLSKLAEYLD